MAISGLLRHATVRGFGRPEHRGSAKGQQGVSITATDGTSLPQEALDGLIEVEAEACAIRPAVRLLLALVPVLAGCATTSTPGQVQEAGPGTYKVAIGHTVRAGYDKEYEAVSLAGQYCHAKGQKLVVVPTHDNDVVTFRCESSSEPVTSPPSTPPPSN